MMLGAIGSFAQNFGDGIQAGRDRQEREKERARQDALLDRAEQAPALGAVPDVGAAVGQASQSSGGYGTPAAGQGGGTTDMLGLIDRNEGGGNDDTLFGNSQNGGRFAGTRVSEMTIGEALQFADPSGPYGQWVKSSLAESGQDARVATPMGRYQIVGTTLRNAAQEMGLPMDARFDATTQQSIAAHLANRRLAGAASPDAQRAALRAEWEGFKLVPDAQLDAAIAGFLANGGQFESRPLGAVAPQGSAQ